jgi:biotin synthase
MPDVQKLLDKIYHSVIPEIEDLESVLSFQDDGQIAQLFNFSDKVRKEFCGDGVALRGIIEFSNYCSRECFYCGINKNNHRLRRYRMDEKQILDAVEYLASCNIKTVVLQSGEDGILNALWMKEVIEKIKSRWDIAITLSVGERSADDYKTWRKAGADRYLLKIETSEEALYSSMHPGMDFKKRLDCLRILKELNYQVGSGNLIGLPAQSLKMIAQDIIFFKRNDFDMIGIGPFIPHQDTRFAGQNKGNVFLTLKTIALTRLVTKNAHIPATTALGSMDRDYRLDGLKCGANILMPNFTPAPYRKFYEIYPQKRCVNEPVGVCNLCMETMVKGLGRFIDYSQADSLKSGKKFKQILNSKPEIPACRQAKQI